ncbi:TDP-4-oxo-6-deoxy-D-glucose aminotransferase [Sporocytophaga myxococcoides]|uniref:TDP-4-oxo-6-deoxy-D-glucose aminotransferase n=1 Tax=Sporocytophaga myxococcoides TaxID=153721 RepID=A0A098LJC3_9BACT|nr:dTDP-4-amino-4,6-dideoxygalactose transaminase [Sporocytophaga myxococcoides]GAL86497.1 TDP-4-oxo-6-deoxy-D-glucose aminotransferase [Sporocytophaga myxococcoides]
MIPYNKPFIIGKELEYIRQAVESGKISGDGKFSKLCQSLLEKRFGYGKVLLTSSCTDALEMCGILLNISEDDEVIMPSFTFVSTANAFILRGAKIVFADIRPDTLNIDESKIEALITPKTKALVIVHYAGVSCNMEKISAITEKHSIALVEDAALAIDSYYKGKALGSFGQLSTLSFHETKNIIAGEGGALIINDPQYFERAEIIREKGTNRAKLFRGEINKYEWVDIGSSYLPSEIIAAFLYAQLENMDTVIKKRISLWNLYFQKLKPLQELSVITLPILSEGSTMNGQLFYLLCNNEKDRNNLLDFLNQQKIKAVFHYLPLHLSPFYINKHDGRSLPVTESTSGRLIRLPLFYEMKDDEQNYIISKIFDFFNINH